MKNAIKELKSCQNRAEAEAKLKEAVSIIDKAAQKNIIHKNKAARDKSQLMNIVRGLSS
jgi:small subunit ribosomal protein S20